MEQEISQAEPRTKKRWWVALFGGWALWFALFLHVFFAAVATYIVVEHFQKKHINFQATAPPAPHADVEHKVEMAKKNSVESAPPDLKQIVTTDVTPITLPDVPQMPTTDETTPTTMAGTGDIGEGMGNGNGAGNGNGGGSPAFGVIGGSGFEGTLYDMKQTPDGQPTDIAATGAEADNFDAIPLWDRLPATQNELRVLHSFLVGGWDTSMLDGYYKAPQTLHTEQIFIPKLKAAEAPKAFQVEGKVQPRRWIVIYKATIVPPESGDFRFVGFADDFLVVRVGGRNVLDGSWSSEKLLPEANDSANAGPAPGYADRQGQRLAAGKWITMEAGASLEMEVMIGEGPGGDSSFFLFIQQRGVDSAPGDYPVFQLKDVEVPSWTDPDGVPSGFTKKKMVFGISDQ